MEAFPRILFNWPLEQSHSKFEMIHHAQIKAAQFLAVWIIFNAWVQVIQYNIIFKSFSTVLEKNLF